MRFREEGRVPVHAFSDLKFDFIHRLERRAEDLHHSLNQVHRSFLCSTDDRPRVPESNFCTWQTRNQTALSDHAIASLFPMDLWQSRIKCPTVHEIGRRTNFSQPRIKVALSTEMVGLKRMEARSTGCVANTRGGTFRTQAPCHYKMVKCIYPFEALHCNNNRSKLH